MVKSISKGDQVVTTGGIFGEIVKVEDGAGIIHLQIADNVQIRVRQEMVSEVTKPLPTKTEALQKQKSKGKKK